MNISPKQGSIDKMYEDALLGFIITDPSKMLETSQILPSEDYFANPDNRATYAIFLKLYEEDRFPSSPALMVKELYTGGSKGARKRFATENEAARYVNHLIDASTVDAAKFRPSAYKEYAEQIKWTKQKNDIVTMSKDALGQVDEVSYNDREEFINKLEDDIAGISMSVHGSDGLKSISEMTAGVSEQLEALHNGKQLESGVKTGIDGLDTLLNGLKGGEVCVLAARPSAGKTTLSMQIAYNVATEKPKKKDDPQNAVLMFSLEMMEDQLVSRLIATVGRINMQSFIDEYQHLVSDDGNYYKNTYSADFQNRMRSKLEEQYTRTQIALDEIKKIPIYPTTESGLTPNAIKSMVMSKKKALERDNKKVALIIIDYLQLMTPNLQKRNASRTEEVGDMSRKMKLLAKELDVPVLLIAQLNRNADVDKRPELKDLRESGSIEQDADKVIFIWNEHALQSPSDFTEYRDDASKREALRKEQMKTVITVAKNRQGEIGDVHVIFDKGFQTFISQSDSYSALGEQFDDFAEKYYQKTRTEDIFWPLREGEIPRRFESHRHPMIMENPYLTNDGRVVRLKRMGDNGNSGANVEVRTNINTSKLNKKKKPPTEDKIVPRQVISEIDDTKTDFAELPDDDTDEEENIEATVNDIRNKHNSLRTSSRSHKTYDMRAMQSALDDIVNDSGDDSDDG